MGEGDRGPRARRGRAYRAARPPREDRGGARPLGAGDRGAPAQRRPGRGRPETADRRPEGPAQGHDREALGAQARLRRGLGGRESRGHPRVGRAEAGLAECHREVQIDPRPLARGDDHVQARTGSTRWLPGGRDHHPVHPGHRRASGPGGDPPPRPPAPPAGGGRGRGVRAGRGPRGGADRRPGVPGPGGDRAPEQGRARHDRGPQRRPGPGDRRGRP